MVAKLFSFLYKPGAMNFQIWVKNIGLVMNIEAKKQPLHMLKKLV